MYPEVGRTGFIDRNVIRWIIPSFDIFIQNGDTRIWSPPFPWILGNENFGPYFSFSLYELTKIPMGYLGIIVVSTDKWDTPIKSVKFGMTNDRKSDICCSYGEWVEKNRIYKVLIPMDTESFERPWERHLNPQPFFRVFSEVTHESKRDAVNASILNRKVCAITDAEISSNEDNESENSSPQKKSNESHKDKSDYFKNLEMLSQNFKDLYIQGQDADLVLMVKDQEFKAHKAILRSRSPVFNAMFLHELSENTSGIVPIEDCEPAVFDEFLLFVYTGKTENLSSNNACELYYIADKYQLMELKEKCVDFLKNSLSVETICDIICLSSKHVETELLDLATTFFARNMEKILVTVKWQLFLKENPTEANELIIKALKIGRTENKFKTIN